MKMKEIPNENRPYERCEKDGPEHLSDSELLSVLIRTGSQEQNSLELASSILALNYPDDGMLGLMHLTLPKLTSLKGIGRVKAVQLMCVGEISKRIWKRKARENQTAFCSPKAVAEYFQEDMRHLRQEQFYIMLFDTKQKLIRDVLISKGTVNTSLASPREIFIQALKYEAVSLRCQAVSIILVHNHPSGDPSPSKQDIALTQKVLEAGSLIGIGLLDHVVIGEHSYVSMKERGLI